MVNLIFLCFRGLQTRTHEFPKKTGAVAKAFFRLRRRDDIYIAGSKLVNHSRAMGNAIQTRNLKFYQFQLKCSIICVPFVSHDQCQSELVKFVTSESVR